MDGRLPGFTIQEFDKADDKVKNLIKLASEARQKSYSPYSKFAVGAAVLCKDGKIFQGCNVENSSYGVSICAEQTAVVKAVSSGVTDISAVGVVADSKTFTTPCGKCRQFLNEFGLDVDVYCSKPDLKEILITTLPSLLPMSFHLQR